MSVRKSRTENQDLDRERPAAEKDLACEARLDEMREKAKPFLAAADKAIKREAQDGDEFLEECRQEGGQ